MSALGAAVGPRRAQPASAGPSPWRGAAAGAPAARAAAASAGAGPRGAPSAAGLPPPAALPASDAPHTATGIWRPACPRDTPGEQRVAAEQELSGPLGPPFVPFA